MALTGETIRKLGLLKLPELVSIIAEQYHTNVDLGARMIFLTTLFCMVTVPLFMGIGLG